MSFEKYLKYKNKYLELKNSKSPFSLKGGARIEVNELYSMTPEENKKCEELLKLASPSEPTDEYLRCLAHRDGKLLLNKWLGDRDSQIQQVLNLFDPKGIPYVPPSATCFSDLYKWTMMPVIKKLESLKNNNITVTFGIDLREPTMREALRVDHATSERKLIKKIHNALKTLEARQFDRRVFDEVLTGSRAEIFEPNTIESICIQDGVYRTLVDAGGVKDYNTQYVRSPEDKDKVTINFYYKSEKEYSPAQLNEDGSKKKAAENGVHFIEATGPWHRVTWLETSMMQCVYEAKLRYDLENADVPYSNWLYGALLRCAKSVAYTRLIQKIKPTFKPALFTGRRTGGLVFLMLQNMFFADHFTQFIPGNSMVVPNSIAIGTDTECLGTSSVDSWVLLRRMGLPCLTPAGTHAHELSMVSSALFPHIDQNKYSLPITQVIGHYLYYKLVWEKTRGPMPMLPDTLGTRAFMKAANLITVDVAGNPMKFIDVIQSARQDSGKLQDFKDNMIEFKYLASDGSAKIVADIPNSMMASEIDTSKSLFNALKIGYASFGAGGFFGDSEKVWGNPNVKSNSMAVKAVRVMYEDSSEANYEPISYMRKIGNVITGFPVKIGDPDERLERNLKEGKLSLDKNLTNAELIDIKRYAANVREKAVNAGYEAPVVAPADGIHIDTFFNIKTGIVEAGLASLRGGNMNGGGSILNWLFN